MVHPDFHDGAKMLRRGYNFVDGSDAIGGLDAGLFFLAFVRNPDTHFIPIQTKMANSDALMEYLKVKGSALFAVPPGIAEGEYVGQALFDPASFGPGRRRRSLRSRASQSSWPPEPSTGRARCARQRSPRCARRLVGSPWVEHDDRVVRAAGSAAHQDSASRVRPRTSSYAVPERTTLATPVTDGSVAPSAKSRQRCPVDLAHVADPGREAVGRPSCSRDDQRLQQTATPWGRSGPS